MAENHGRHRLVRREAKPDWRGPNGVTIATGLDLDVYAESQLGTILKR